MEYLKVWTSFAEIIEPLNDSERGRLFTMMLSYAATGEQPELKGNERYVWPVAKQAIDRTKAENDKLTVNGSKGGRPKAKETNENQDKPNETNENQTKPYKEKDKDKDKEKEKILEGGGNNTRTREAFPPQDDELADPQASEVPEWVDMLTMYGIKMSTGAWQEMREIQEQGAGGDLICWAVEQAVNAGACNWNYLSRVLNNCLKLGCKTRARAEELAAQRKAELAKPKEAPVKPVYQKPQEPKKVNAQNYEQRQYTDDFMNSFVDDALEEARRLHAQREAKGA